MLDILTYEENKNLRYMYNKEKKNIRLYDESHDRLKYSHELERSGKTEMASSKFTSAKHIPQNHKAFNKVKSSYPPTDATLQGCPFNVRNFLACKLFISLEMCELFQFEFKSIFFWLYSFVVGSSTGVIALIEIPKQKWYFILPHPVAAMTSMDAHPER